MVTRFNRWRQENSALIRLHQFGPVWELSTGSPFCLKVETYLRMAGVDYLTVFTPPFRAPKGKLPFIDDDGVAVADSGFIIAHLKTKYGDLLDAGLSPLQRATAHALRRMIEESLYWSVMYGRWIDPAGWVVHAPEYFRSAPPLLRQVLAAAIRRSVRKQLHGQGYGRHSRDEVFALGCADLVALSESLGGQPYLTGIAPTSVDAAAYGFLAHILFVPVENPLKAQVAELPNLVEYAERMRERYFP